MSFGKKPRICAIGMLMPTYEIQLISLMKVFQEHGIESIKITQFQNKILKFLDILFFLPLNRKKYDVIHIQAHSRFNIISVMIALFWSKILRKKIVMMYYGGAAKEFFSISPIFFKTLFNQIDQIVVAGRYIQSVFDDLGMQTKIIPHILDIEKWPFRQRESSKFRLVWVRHLWKEYNPIMLLQVFQILKARYPKLELKIIGGGYLKDDMMNYISKNSLESVELMGRVSDATLKSTLDWADVFLNTTNVDNQPVSVLEAMTCGCPIVSTNPGGIPDIITHRDNGLLSDPNDVDAMVKNIELLFEDRQIYSFLSERGREYVVNKFGKQKIFEQWVEIYAALGYKLN